MTKEDLSEIVAENGLDDGIIQLGIFNAFYDVHEHDDVDDGGPGVPGGDESQHDGDLPYGRASK